MPPVKANFKDIRGRIGNHSIGHQPKNISNNANTISHLTDSCNTPFSSPPSAFCHPCDTAYFRLRVLSRYTFYTSECTQTAVKNRKRDNDFNRSGHPFLPPTPMGEKCRARQPFEFRRYCSGKVAEICAQYGRYALPISPMLRLPPGETLYTSGCAGCIA